jgi:response regulator RpfG family c-di-GMP phosphodiesterase
VSTIPRLEGVAQAIGGHVVRYDGQGSGMGIPRGEHVPLAARILRLAADFDAGMTQRPSVQATISALRADAGAYDTPAWWLRW